MEIDYQRLAHCIVNELRTNEVIVNLEDCKSIREAEDKLLTAREVAELLGVTPSTITALRKAHRLKFVVINKAPRYYYRDVMEYRKRRTI